MTIIDLPLCHKDMNFSVSLTGLTYLSDGRYKQRYNLPKNIVQIPGRAFQKIEDYKKTHHHEFLRKKPRKKANNPSETRSVKQSKKRVYVIDKKQVTHRIKNYVNQMKGEKLLYFWTVSFPVHTTDNTAHLLLNKWLTRLRKERMIKEYLWVTERQENGTIHFHMIINNRMDVTKANRFMRASIMYSIDNGEVKWSRDAAMKYNGIDIAKDRKTNRVINFARQNKQRSLTAYITKYITKNDTQFNHLAWHSSRGYSCLITSIRFTYDELIKLNIVDMLDNESIITTQYFNFRRWKYKPPDKIVSHLNYVNNLLLSLISIT